MKAKDTYYHGASKKTFDNAKSLRQNQTNAEWFFWRMVSNRKILGLKFRRQHPIDKYIVDFYCHEALLVVELDGSVHDLDRIKRYDKKREIEITKMGLKIIRFTNEEVLFDAENTINKLKEYLIKII